MTFVRLICIAVSLAVTAGTALAQVQETGTVDYALANSSVMWIPSSSALFLNPGELARIHQNEFLVSSGRFRSLLSMAGDWFIPGSGTFGLGVRPFESSTLYSFGYGGLIGNYNTLGAAVSVIPNVESGFRFSFGGSIHLPFNVEESGIHLGLNVSNLPTGAFVNVGGAYWLVPNAMRIQLSTRTDAERAEYLGVALRISGGLYAQVGTRGFNKMVGGLSYATSYATVQFGGGPEGVSFTMNVRIGEAARALRDQARSEATRALADGHFEDAGKFFQHALTYDEYDEDSRSVAKRSQFLLDSSVTALLRQARESEDRQNFPEAMRAYAQVLKLDPRQSTAASSLANVEKRLKLYVRQLLVAGDSLKDIDEIDDARGSYQLALELDPGNDSASVRIKALDDLSKETTLAILTHARSLLRKGDLDLARDEFQRVLSADPANTQAKSGLHSIAIRKTDELVARGKAAYDSGNYFGALQVFVNIIAKDENNKAAKQLLDETREKLKSDVDKLFKNGLAFYIKEDFRSAIAEWDKVLMIQPSDSSTLEYRKRAEEKLKALELFK